MRIDGNNMDRRTFLKVTMLGSGALMVGVGYYDLLTAGEDRSRPGGEDRLPDGGGGMPRGRLEGRARGAGTARRPLRPPGHRGQPRHTGRLGRSARRGFRGIAHADDRRGKEVSELKLKSRPSEFKLLGTRVPGVDNDEIVTGQPLFGSDIRLDGMLYAQYEKCPVFGGKVRSTNVEEISALPGVTHAFVVQGTDDMRGLQPGVAIAGETWWAVNRARKQLKVDWETTQADSSTEYEKQARALAGETGEILRHDGDVEAAFESAEKIVEAAYYYPYVSHANMEPQVCTALQDESGGMEFWAPSQNPRGARRLVSRTLDIPEDKIHVNLARIGGGFGRRLRHDYMVETAWIARETGKPVQLQWTREDDMRHDFYRPGAWHRFKAGLDGAGRMVAFDHHFITMGHDGEPASGADLSPEHYPAGLVPHFRLRQSLVESRAPTGPWRSPGHSAYCFAYQGFFDEVALAAGRDPLEFRLDLLSRSYGELDFDPKRTAGALKIAAEKAGWGRELPDNRGLGMAFHFDHGGSVSHVVEVVAEGSAVKVERVWSGIDIGPVINMSGAMNQVEGGFIDGLSTAQLEITFAGGSAEQANFDTYPLLRIDQAPEIECHFVQSDIPPSGLGEPPIAAAAPAIANAIFAATGVRIRELPFSRSGITV
jgi:isoquinoline 1-oxidoreductase beta subunit